MIFITVGSQKFQFDRLLMEMDRISGKEEFKHQIFAQIGYCNYKPKNFQYKNFLTRDEFDLYIDKCKIMITHGGTGAIIGGLKRDKKVIAIPRDKNYGEHIDNHQYEIVSEFSKMNLICGIEKIKELKEEIKNIEKRKFEIYKSNTKIILKDIEEYIKTI